MTILDRSTGNRIRIDANQFADELAKRLPDVDKTRDHAANAVHDAVDQARHQFDRAAEIAKVIRGDIAHSADKVVTADNPIDEIGQRIRAVASTTAVRALIARLEKELPEVDRDKYHRAYMRGRTQARSRYLVAGLVAGIGAGAVAAILLDPKHGKERREAIARKTSSLTKSAGKTVAGKAKFASDRARGIAIERGVIKPPADQPADAPLVPVFADGTAQGPSATWAPSPDAAGQALPGPEPVPAGVAPETPTLDAAGDHGIAPSNHG